MNNQIPIPAEPLNYSESPADEAIHRIFRKVAIVGIVMSISEIVCYSANLYSMHWAKATFSTRYLSIYMGNFAFSVGLLILCGACLFRSKYAKFLFYWAWLQLAINTTSLIFSLPEMRQIYFRSASYWILTDVYESIYPLAIVLICRDPHVRSEMRNLPAL